MFVDIAREAPESSAAFGPEHDIFRVEVVPSQETGATMVCRTMCL